MNGYTFERRELKYRITDAQRAALEAAFDARMVPDEYGESTICNIYYDTADYRLIRASLEKPAYKEKLRLRSYGVTEPGGEVFLELKKKYKGIVYKRRITLPEDAAGEFIAGRAPLPERESEDPSHVARRRGLRAVRKGEHPYEKDSFYDTCPCALSLARRLRQREPERHLEGFTYSEGGFGDFGGGMPGGMGGGFGGDRPDGDFSGECPDGTPPSGFDGSKPNGAPPAGFSGGSGGQGQRA